jgi:hypothetical protein
MAKELRRTKQETDERIERGDQHEQRGKEMEQQQISAHQIANEVFGSQVFTEGRDAVQSEGTSALQQGESKIQQEGVQPQESNAQEQAGHSSETKSMGEQTQEGSDTLGAASNEVVDLSSASNAAREIATEAFADAAREEKDSEDNRAEAGRLNQSAKSRNRVGG